MIDADVLRGSESGRDAFGRMQLIYALGRISSVKQVEVLAPNLPLFFRLPAVDGYDGGLLPLHRYVKLQELFLSSDRMTPDGRSWRQP